MTDGMNIPKISSPIFGASRIKRAGRESPDSRKRYFQKHLEDEKESKSDDSSGFDTDRSERETEMKNGKEGSEGGKMQNPLHQALGKRIDIRV